jgi:hypothetical protein
MAVVVIVVVGAFTLLGDRGSSSSGDPGGTTAGAQPSTSPTTTGSPAPSASSSTPAGSATGSAPAGEVDKTIELRVLNSISVSGLAKKYADQLKDDDWKVASTGDSNQRDLAKTRVYYGKTSQKDSADAIVAALGFGEVKKSAGNAGPGITIVLGEDASS